MPCQSYDDNWRSYDSDRDKVKELKKQADMLDAMWSQTGRTRYLQ
jgi:hypothetical protein